MLIATENTSSANTHCGTASGSDRLLDSKHIWAGFWHHENSSSVE